MTRSSQLAWLLVLALVSAPLVASVASAAPAKKKPVAKKKPSKKKPAKKKEPKLIPNPGQWHLYQGRIVKSGTKELALELEEKGYDWIKEEVAASA